jgi:uncharacterized protein (DUF1919 family)
MKQDKIKIKKLQKESDKHYKFIENFVNDYCSEDEDKFEFFKHLNGYLDNEIELEMECSK